MAVILFFESCNYENIFANWLSNIVCQSSFFVPYLFVTWTNSPRPRIEQVFAHRYPGKRSTPELTVCFISRIPDGFQLRIGVKSCTKNYPILRDLLPIMIRVRQTRDNHLTVTWILGTILLLVWLFRPEITLFIWWH